MTSGREAAGTSGREAAGTWRRAAWTVACDVEFAPAEPDHDKPDIVEPPAHGAPLGGFGAGTFARTYRGDVARWHFRPARHVFASRPACAAVVSVEGDAPFAIGPDPTDGALSSWTFRRAGIEYAALYPRSAFTGTSGDVEFEWLQFSPIWPGTYREIGFPVAVNRWRLTNRGDTPRNVTIAHAWENVSFVAPGERSGPTSEIERGDDWLRVGRRTDDPDEEGSFAFAIGGADAMSCGFDPDGGGAEAWRWLAGDGSSDDPAPPSDDGAVLFGGRVVVAPGDTIVVDVAFAWHIPTVGFDSGRRWYRPHTKHVGRELRGGAADPSVALAREAVSHADEWERTIDAWQAPIVAARPPALARSLFNQLYVLADASTWTVGEADPGESALPPLPDVPGQRDIGRFAVLECFTYPYLSTLDVRYYGTLPLVYLWPELERQVLVQYAEAALRTDDEARDMLHVVERVARKQAGTLPHDLGAPHEDPWVKVNAYDDIDPNRWKDLGPKFVLQVDRYLCAVGWEDRGFLRAVWPAVSSALEHTSRQDTDGDGLPENEGIPDQTFDKWPMTGPSAYCSILTIAALHAGARIAEWCGDRGAAVRYDGWRRAATRSLHDTLWRDGTFAYDTDPATEGMVMSGQLSGAWSLELSGHAPVLPPDVTAETLDTVWSTCRVDVDGAFGGLRNGAARPGATAPDNRHAREVWTGINYAIASHMILHDRVEAGLAIVDALDRVTHEARPFAFWVPEAWDDQGRYRGAMYHRPLSVWGVEEALRRTTPSPDLPPMGGAPPEAP